MSKILKSFQRDQDAIRRTIAKYRPNPADIEELVQETFLKAYAAEQIEDIRKPKHFLLKVAKHVALSAATRKSTKFTKSVEDLAGIEVYEDESTPSPHRKLESKEGLFIMTQAIASLPEELSRALWMRRVEGLKYKQIALRLNISVSMVEKRVTNAMVDCMLFLKKNGYEPSDIGFEPKTKRPKPESSDDQVHSTNNLKLED